MSLQPRRARSPCSTSGRRAKQSDLPHRCARASPVRRPPAQPARAYSKAAPDEPTATARLRRNLTGARKTFSIAVLSSLARQTQPHLSRVCRKRGLSERDHQLAKLCCLDADHSAQPHDQPGEGQ